MSNQETNGTSNAPQDDGTAYGRWHRRVLENRGGLFAILMTVAILIGGIVEIVPMYTAEWGPERGDWVSPYTPLEVAGRDIYIREGCYVCHSQWIRPTRAETMRYGEWTRAPEYKYDRPFLLGSRRLGPDLQRVGGKYPDAWHYEHMRDPRSVSPGSVMPPYSWLIDWTVDPEDIQASVKALQRAGTPYTDQEVASVPESMAGQADGIVSRLASSGIQVAADREIIALIAYLQRLGVDGRRHLSKQGGDQ